MGIVKECAAGGRELSLTGGFEAGIKSGALVLAAGFALYRADLVATADGAAHAIRPAYLFEEG